MMIVLGLLCIFFAICILTVLGTVVTNQYRENFYDHFDFFEHMFHKPRTLLTDILSKLIAVFIIFLSVGFVILGINLILI